MNRNRKKRKPYNGSVRNVEEKKKRFKQAIGKILISKGFRGLGINKISLEAGISKNLIYRYFGSYKNLIEQYGEEIDFWINLPFPIELSEKEEIEHLGGLLSQMFNYHTANPELQRLILWELQDANYNTCTLLKKREQVGEQFFDLIEEKFKEKVDFRAMAAILIASVYHLSAFSSVQKTTFCGIDLHEEKGKKRIFEALKVLLESIYSLKNGKFQSTK